jgi:hypothetical protein
LWQTGNSVSKNLAALRHIRQESARNKLLEKQMRKVMMGAAAAAMLVASSLAQAAPVANARAGAPVADAEGQALGGDLVLVVLLVAAIVAFGFAVNEGNDGETLPRSP